MSDRSGYTIWFTGLSGTGQDTIAELVGPELEKRGALVEYLDGDVVRTHLSKGLGFSKEDRDTNIERIGWVASRFTRAGVVTLVSAISPYADARAPRAAWWRSSARSSRSSLTPRSRSAPSRDVKGLYAKAFSGEIKEFTGVSDPYEAPESPDVHIQTEAQSPEESAAQVLAALEARGLAGDAVAAPAPTCTLHTVASDGSLAPAALVELAAAAGVGVLAVTDHDTLDGVPEALEAGAALGVRVIPGVEVSVRAPSGSMHLLGYLTEAAPEPIASRLAALREARAARASRIVERLVAIGAPVSLADVAARAGGPIGRPHIADALVAAGHARDRQDAFDRFLADGGPPP